MPGSSLDESHRKGSYWSTPWTVLHDSALAVHVVAIEEIGEEIDGDEAGEESAGGADDDEIANVGVFIVSVMSSVRLARSPALCLDHARNRWHLQELGAYPVRRHDVIEE